MSVECEQEGWGWGVVPGGSEELLGAELRARRALGESLENRAGKGNDKIRFAFWKRNSRSRESPGWERTRRRG